MISFFVPGRPQAQGSKTKGRWGNIHEDNMELGPWRERVALAGYAAAHGPEAGSLGSFNFVFDKGTPIAIGLEFVLYRPASAPKKRTPPATKKPDIDKMERAILDALTDVLWPDDSQVTIVLKRKRVAEIGESPGVHVWITEAPPVTSETPAPQCCALDGIAPHVHTEDQRHLHNPGTGNTTPTRNFSDNPDLAARSSDLLRRQKSHHREHVARLLYEEMRECCNGYVEHVPEDQPICGSGITFDGDISVDVLADFVIAKFTS